MNHRHGDFRFPRISRRGMLARLGALGLALAGPGSALSAGAAQASTEGARDFIEHLGNQVAESAQLDRAALQRLISGALDVDAIGRFALGPFLRQSNPQKVQEYLGVFRNYVLMAYPELLAKLNIRRLRVIAVNGADAETSFVLTEIGYGGSGDGNGGDGGGDTAEVGWNVREVAAGDYKVQDVQVNGHSLRAFQRAKFEKILRDRWIDGLIKIMQGWVRNGREEPYL